MGRHQTCSKERIEVLSDAIERHHSLQYTPSLLYPESCPDGNWRNHLRQKFLNHPPKISLRHDWMKELGSEVARPSEVNQPNQPNRNPIYRTARPVVTEQTSRSSAHEIDTRLSRDCKNTNLFVERSDEDEDTDKNLDVDADHDRTGRPVVCREPIGSSTTFNEVDIDFRTSGLPHSVVKQAENSRVRELVKKIENHPHRQDLQADLHQNNAYNPFSERSKKIITDIYNVELFELCETIPKVQCNAKDAFFTGIKASFTALAGIS